MISNLGKGAGKWVVRILLVLLILSFAFWGINDYITGPTNPPVADVGGEVIDASTFANEASRRLRLLQQQQNMVLQPREALAFGIYDQVLSSLIDRRTLNLRATELGLAVPDSAVSAAAHANPNFQNQLGQYDPVRFEQVIRQLGYRSPNAFAEDLRGDLIRRQIQASVTAGLEVGVNAYARALFAFQNEARNIRFISVPNDRLADTAPPSENDLTTYHEAHPELFSTPERRRILLIDLSPEIIAQDIVVDDAEIEQAYQDQIASFSVAGSRTVDQAIFPDEDAANAVLASVNEGLSFAAAVEKQNGNAPTSLGTVRPGDVPGDLGDAVFNASVGEVAGPVQTAFGWHLVQVTEVTEATTRPLAEVREELLNAIRIEHALERVIDLGNQVEDELAGGNRLRAVGDAVGVAVREIGPIDRNGVDMNGAELDTPLPPQALEIAFAQTQDEDLERHETSDGGYFVVEVVEVMEPELRPFAEVETEVTAAWRAENLAKAAADVRNKLLERLQAGTTLDGLASEFDVTVQTADSVTRQGGAPELAGNLRSVVFSAQAGDHAAGAHASEPAQVLAEVVEIVEANPLESAGQIAALEAAIGESMAEDAFATYQQQLRDEFGVGVNRQAMIQAIDPALLRDIE
ncbi:MULTISPECIES: SurA N-terminal domain-containing protein [unclassified Minwuia]|uniref:SurA N-terminal domain-containing protein n=1 Tax=unclassified Minwuia TaxID=2618799 RepID=UPI002478E009|nr:MULTISPECIES: SurA N-terminal domain-containing protein [unclassified Minwuia]